MNTTYKSHKQFFQILTKNKLNELLHRADEKTNYLQTEINSALPQDYKCRTTVKSDKITESTTECSIYITFFKERHSQPIKIGHYSFHLYPEKSNILSRKNGRLHIKNNQNKQFRYVLDVQKQIQPQQNNYLQLSINKSQALNKELERCVTITQTILNNYFNPNHSSYLGHHLTQFSTTKHECLFPITSSMNKAKIPMRNTRKIKR